MRTVPGCNDLVCLVCAEVGDEVGKSLSRVVNIDVNNLNVQ